MRLLKTAMGCLHKHLSSLELLRTTNGLIGPSIHALEGAALHPSDCEHHPVNHGSKQVEDNAAIPVHPHLLLLLGELEAELSKRLARRFHVS